MTDPVNKAQILLKIAEQIRERANQPSEWLEVLMRAGEVAQMIEDYEERDGILQDLIVMLAQVPEWEEIETGLRASKPHQ